MLFMGINKCHFPRFIDGSQSSLPFRNLSKMSPIQEDPGLQLPNLTLKDQVHYGERCAFHCQTAGINDKLGFSICPFHSEENS